MDVALREGPRRRKPAGDALSGVFEPEAVISGVLESALRRGSEVPDRMLELEPDSSVAEPAPPAALGRRRTDGLFEIRAL